MNTSSQNSQCKRGRSTFETLLVVAALAGVVGTIFAGVQSYQTGNVRSKCVNNITAVQQAVQVHQTTNRLEPGDPFSKEDLVGEGKTFQVEPCCPKSGEPYSWSNRIPRRGRLLVECPHSRDLGHIPAPIVSY